MEKLICDGVALAYEEAGSGARPLLFVHGWTCDHTYLAPQLDHFRARHRVVAVDLRGHGQSDKPEQGYAIEGFAEDLAWLCGQLGIEKPVVVGHSMGGTVALALAARYPDLPAAIVMIDTSVLPSEERIEASRELLRALRGPDYREAQRRFVEERMFLPSTDARLKGRILDEMSSAPRHVMASAWEHIWSFDFAAAALACKVPALFVNAAAPRPELERLRQLCPRVVTGQTVGAGHFNQLEVPDQVNAMIERFLAVLLDPSPSLA